MGIEYVLVGHGKIDSQSYFTIPKNCQVIVYSPEGGTLTNSAIKTISDARCEISGKMRNSQLHDNLKGKLKTDGVTCDTVKFLEAGEQIPSHFLFSLKNRTGEGSLDHKTQFKGSLDRFKDAGCYLQDTKSMSSKIPLEENNSASLEKILEFYSKRGISYTFHWMACREDLTSTLKKTCTRSDENSITLSNEKRKAPHPLSSLAFFENHQSKKIKVLSAALTHEFLLGNGTKITSRLPARKQVYRSSSI